MKQLVFLLISVSFNLGFGFQVSESQDELWITCHEEGPGNQCEGLCRSDKCKVANLTCEACARASDMSVVGLFKRFHRLYDLNGVYQPESLKPWIAKGKSNAIAANSPLNIFADPFSQNDVAELAASFSRVCGVNGNHYVLAEQGASLRPQGILCQSGDEWRLFGLKFRDDYFSEPTTVINQPRP